MAENAVTAGYLICTTPRSGSTLLCSMLASIGEAGAPDSFFHRPDIMLEWATGWNLVTDCPAPDTFDRAYLSAAVVAGCDGGDRFAMRLQHEFLAPLMSRLATLFPQAPSDRARLTAAFGPLRYVHLTRIDKLAQAVSLVKAEQTGLWHRNADGSERERTAPAANPSYDSAAITAAMIRAASADANWKRWFASQGIVPLTVTYESLATAPASTMLMICRAVGIVSFVHVSTDPPTAQMADALSQVWIDRYKAEHAKRSSA